MGGDFPQDLFVDREEHLQATLLDVIIPKENDHLKESVGGDGATTLGGNHTSGMLCFMTAALEGYQLQVLSCKLIFTT